MPSGGAEVKDASLTAPATTLVATPSKADDDAWDKLMAIPFLGAALKALTNFAVIQKK